MATNETGSRAQPHGIREGEARAEPHPPTESRTPVAVITCAVLELEVRHFAAGVPEVAHVEVLEQGLHNEPDRLRAELQRAIDRVEEAVPRAKSIVLGYGLCSRGSEGVVTRRCLLVIPRAHDCITLLLGDKERYAAYVRDHPGTYWYSPGWNKHHLAPGKLRYDTLRAQYVAKFGEDDADFLMESEQAWFKTYERATYVDLGVGATDEDLAYTLQCAQWLGWQLDRQHGDPTLLSDMLRGRWDEQRFVVLAPGQTIRMTADERVIEPTVAGQLIRR